jgi:tetratricopeptide (TPR) repeat protein
MISHSLTIFSVTVVLLFTVFQGYSIAAPNDFTVLINNSPTQSGTPVLVSSDSIVYFEIQQSSNLPIHVDPTGKGDTGYSLNGNLARFSTVYSTGRYNPIIKVGDKTKTLLLIVDEETTDIGWLSFLSQVSWPLFAFSVLIALCFWKKLRDKVVSINQVDIRGVKIEASDLGSRITAALDSAINTIERQLPRTIAARYLPSSLSLDIAHDVHILEFLDDIGAHSGNVNAWNAAGNYHFEHNVAKAEDAYKRAIKLDKNHPDGYANLGLLYLKKDIYTAKRYLTRALELADKTCIPCVVAHIGMVLTAEEGSMDEKLHCEQAKHILQKAVSTDKTDFWSLYFLGTCWSYGDHDLDKAIEYTYRALDIAHDFHAARYNLACFYALKNEPQKSIEVLKEINPTRQILVNIFNFEEDTDWNKVASSPQFKKFCSFMGLSYQPDDSGGPEAK